MKRTLFIALAVGLALVFGDLAMAQTADPLSSWNDGKAKQSIIDFVAKVTKQGSPDFVPQAERWTIVDMKQDWRLIYPHEMK